MHKYFQKILTIFIITIFGLITVKPVFAISPVSGYFSDKETSTENILSATTLDFSVRDTSDVVLTSPLFNITGMVSGNSETKTIRVKKEGVLDFKYNIGYFKTGGDDVLCDVLQVEAKLDGITVYNGNLSALNISPIPTITGGQDDWEMIVSLADSSPGLKNKTCAFNLTYTGWQTDSDGTWGFSDEETLSNSVSTGAWVSSGDVVINELMWMGSVTSGDDEWTELRNTTNNPIDLSGWQITSLVGADNTETLMLTIPSGKTIPANSYFLISNFDKASSALNVDPDFVSSSVVLRNDNLQIKLYKTDWTNSANLIDTADDGIGAPLAGSNGSPDKKSMERNTDPTTGWHTCNVAACHSVTYWDVDGQNWGTPKAANLSENDPSSADYITPTVVPTPTPEPTVNTDPPLESSASSSTIEPTLTPTPTPEVTVTPTPEATITPTPTTEPEPSPTPTS